MVARSLISLLLLVLTCLLSSPCSANSVLSVGESLTVGECLENGYFTLCMQTNCNLVLRYQGIAIWCTHTGGEGTNCRATMQSNGNFVIRSGTRKVWETGTARATRNYFFVLEADGDLVIKNGQGQIIWRRGTNPCPEETTMAPLKETSSIPPSVAASKP